MPTLRQIKHRYLTKRGLTYNEALEFSRNYTLTQIRTLPYIRSLLLSRRRSIMNWRNAGYTDRNIQGAIANLYYRNQWLTPDGKFDPWQMLKKYRRDSINSGDYVPPKKPKHRGVSKGDVDGQRLRARAREKLGGKKLPTQVNQTLERINELNRRITIEKDNTKRNTMIEERNNLWKSIS